MRIIKEKLFQTKLLSDGGANGFSCLTAQLLLKEKKIEKKDVKHSFFLLNMEKIERNHHWVDQFFTVIFPPEQNTIRKSNFCLDSQSKKKLSQSFLCFNFLLLDVSLVTCYLIKNIFIRNELNSQWYCKNNLR